jgi:hypothetical protein
MSEGNLIILRPQRKSLSSETGGMDFMAVSKPKAKKSKNKKHSETVYINKLSQYLHLSNSGFSVSVDVADKATYPHARINLRMGTFGVMNSVMELVTPSHADGFVKPEELLLLSALFAKAAKIVNDVTAVREDVTSLERKGLHCDEDEIERIANLWIQKSDDADKSEEDRAETEKNLERERRIVKNRMIRMHNDAIKRVKKHLADGQFIAEIVAGIEAQVKPLEDAINEKKKKHQMRYAQGVVGGGSDIGLRDEEPLQEWLTYTPEEKKLLAEAYKVYDTTSDEED